MASSVIPSAPACIPVDATRSTWAAAALQHGLRLLMQDTLACVGHVDLTDRAAMQGCLNQVDRLLGVLAEPSPRLRELAAALPGAAATTRPALAAQLYRALATLAAQHGVEERALLDDWSPMR